MFSKKFRWAWDELRKWLTTGKTFGEIADLLKKHSALKGYEFSEAEIIDLIRELKEYKSEVIQTRKNHIASKIKDEVRILPETDDLDKPLFSRYIRNLAEKSWEQSITDKIIKHSSSIADAIVTANEENWKNNKITKGLVIGHVQSGKTANMAGVIALCGDMGFDLVIVLSGIHNKLNEQTTRRFEDDLWTYDRYANELGLKNETMRKIKARRESWSLLTKESDLLTNNTSSLNTLAGPVLGVFKKNKDVFDRLYNWIKKHYEDTLSDLKVLIIDDECDQASPNVADISADEVSAINGRLWEIMSLLPKSSYVGYTATPFANILNEEPGPNSLYPSDFIYTLPTNEKYFGVKEFFGSPDDPDENGMDLIRLVPELEDDLKADYQSLKKAIGYFICTSTVRKYCRNQIEHMTMMIHVSYLVEDQGDVADMVREVLKDYKSDETSTINYLENLWNNERNRVTRDELAKYNGGLKEDYHVTEKFEEFSGSIGNTLKDIVLRIDNYESPKEMRLSYGEDPMCVIAIGGNTLSRGVTLEGLNVSYFTRAGRQYDSLMQMGRWFGYRNGYEDLVRIWTSVRNADHFSHLSLVEQDLRNQVQELYKSGGADPDEIALNVISHPSMKIVRKSAQQSASKVNTSFFNTAPQTTFFWKNDIDWLKNNWEAGERLMQTAFDSTKQVEDIFNPENRNVYRVNAKEVMQFLLSAKCHPNQDASLNGKMLHDFIEKAKNEGYVSKWNVCVPSTLREEKIGKSLSDYKYINRSRIAGNASDDIAYIKTLRGKGDLVCDINFSELGDKQKALSQTNTTIARKRILELSGFKDKEQPGLILLYPIDKDSEARDDESEKRSNLSAKSHVLGWSVAFPAYKQDSNFIERVGINLDKYVG